jgi:hypothetical protein
MNRFVMCAGETIGESRDGHTELALSPPNGPSPVSSKGTSFSLEKCEPTAWLLEEYKLLSAHYFHEDNYFQQSVATFSTLNSGLVAFYASNLVSKGTVAQLTVPVIGITLSLVWMISILRTRERRRYAENRMVEIESALHASWKIEGTPIGPLDIGTRARWEEVGKTGAWGKLHLGWIRDIQASKLALALPPAFIIIWVVLFIVL